MQVKQPALSFSTKLLIFLNEMFSKPEMIQKKLYHKKAQWEQQQR